MTEFDLEFEGVEKTLQRFQQIKEQYDGDGITYITGTTVEYGVILEFGRGPIRADDGYLRFENEDGDTIFRKEVSGHPPYPWFRPAIREFKANPKPFIIKNTDFNSIDAIQTTEELVATVATALQEQMRANVNAQKAGDRSPGTHPNHPRRDSGNLSASILAVRIN